MATSGDDLLDQAQTELWKAAQSLPAPGQHRRDAARTLFRGQLSAWPDLARATRYAITVLPLDREASQRYEPVLAALDRVERSGGYGHGQAPTDPHFARAAALTGAAGDAMKGSRTLSSAADLGPQDRLLAHVESAARLTAAYAELAVAPMSSGATTAGRWLRLGEAARTATITPLSERRSPVSAAPIPAVDEDTLAGSLDRWRRAALDVAAGGPAAASGDLPLIAAALSTVQSAADATGLRPSDRVDSTTIWREAAAAWPSSVRIAGPAAFELRGATSALRADLVTFVQRTRRGDPDHAADEALAHFASRPGTRVVAVAYRDAVLEAVSTGRPVIAARRLAEVSGPPLPAELAEAATKGRWVPLPPTSAPAQLIVSTTIAAADSSHYDRGGTPGLSLDAEAAAARMSSSAGFGRCTRDMLQAASETGKLGASPLTAAESDGLEIPRRER